MAVLLIIPTPNLNRDELQVAFQAAYSDNKGIASDRPVNLCLTTPFR